MRVLIQRVRRAQVSVEDELVATIGAGYVLLVGVGRSDTEEAAWWLARKVVGLRLFAGDRQRAEAAGSSEFDKSLLEVAGEALVVSQFTLHANAKKGRRPSFTEAAAPAQAKPLYEQFARYLRDWGVKRVQTGRFGASMQVELVNDGPVTIWLDSQQ